MHRDLNAAESGAPMPLASRRVVVDRRHHQLHDPIIKLVGAARAAFSGHQPGEAGFAKPLLNHVKGRRENPKAAAAVETLRPSCATQRSISY